MTRKLKTRKKKARKKHTRKPRLKVFYFKFYVKDLKNWTIKEWKTWKIRAEDENKAWEKAIRKLGEVRKEWEKKGYGCNDYVSVLICGHSGKDEYEIGIDMM